MSDESSHTVSPSRHVPPEATSNLSGQSAPPQPPLSHSTGYDNPPIVDGIDGDDIASESYTVSPSASSEIPSTTDSDQLLDHVRPGDLAAFSELFARFHSRIESVSAGRKYRPLRDAWDAASDEITRSPDKVHLALVADLVIQALRIGCESNKTTIVDSCIDCIHRLFEYGHVGGSGESTAISFDMRDGALDDLVAIVCSCLEVKDESIYMRMVQTLLTAATRTKSGLHQSTLLAAVRTIYNIYLNAHDPGTRTTARVSLTQILNLVFSRMEAETAEDVSNVPAFSDSHKTIQPSAYTAVGSEGALNASSSNLPNQAEDDTDPQTEFSSVLQRDAYLLFRALCKLSARELPSVISQDSVAIRSKLLSLELIHNLINASGPAFRSGERFIYALSQYLARSLLVNCMSSSLEVMDISFGIFELLLRKDTFRPLLKTEIKALFEIVIFRYLESPKAGNARRRRALTFLGRLSADRQTMADIFLNYDCDMDSPKIFERVVNTLSAAAQEKSLRPADSHQTLANNDDDAFDARTSALSAVVRVVRSLREWSKPLEESSEVSTLSNSGSKSNESTVSLSSSHLDTVSGEFMEGRPAVQSEVARLSQNPRPEGHLSSSQGGAGMVSEVSDRDTTRFEEALKAKKETSEGIKLFNSKPKRGVEYLVQHGRIRDESEDIANFLHRAEDLDATMVGEYLGDGNDFNIKVMHAYTDMHNFKNMTFDGALRLHLSGFRLPGEAQKIDRIMEKFASRYCECNPDIFANADAAYVLAYSTIMLHTDAHNDTIKNKMSKEEFIRNNRGINDGGDLDPVFLGKLYDRITKTEIRLSTSKKDSTAGTGKSLTMTGTEATMDPVQRARQFEQESKQLQSETKELFAKNRRSVQHVTYYTATNVHLARLMFETAWYPVLAAISLNLEEASTVDSEIVSYCLEGFRHGIAISSTFALTTAKNAFVSSLAKFTHLSSISEMRTKNVECLRMMLAIAAMEGDNLGDQWVLIVRAISLLEQIRALASGNGDKHLLQKTPTLGVETSFNVGSGGNSVSNTGLPPSKGTGTEGTNSTVPVVSGDTFRRISTVRGSSTSSSNLANADDSHNVDSKTATLATTIAESEIERVFTNSANLSPLGVVDFCGALCTVSLEELSEKPLPRLFCIQKIIEMAYYNMESRTRLQWGKIWDQMGPFFVSAMCHVNRDVAMYAIDALRQLSSKFLEKDELSNFAFQRSFLKPFEMCFGESRSPAIRELVLSCISQIVLARAANIKSGWKSVFGVLCLAADDKTEAIMNFGWQVVESITRKYVGVLDDVFVDAVMGISAYVKSTLSTVISLAAIDLLSGRCAFALRAEKAEAQGTFSAEDDSHIGHWFPVLTGLASAIHDERSAVRNAASNGLYRVLSEHGGQFAPSMWALVFRGVLSPVFDDVRHLSSSNDRNETAIVGEWATSTGAAALRSVVDVVVEHLATSRTILEDVLGLIQNWVSQESESVAREGMTILARLITSAGDSFIAEDWEIVVGVLTRMFEETMPYEIIGSSDSPGTSKLLETNGSNRVLENGSYDVNDEKANMDTAENSKAEDRGGLGNTRDAGTEMDAAVDEVRESNIEGRGDSKIDFRVVRAKCVVQLLLIEVVQEVVVSFYSKLSTEQIMSLSTSLEKSHTFAHRFNADVELRYSLWRAGFMNQVPNLLKQETNGLMAYLRIMFWLYLDVSRGDSNRWSEDKLMALCERVLRHYIESCEEAPSKPEERREVTALSPVVCFIVSSVMQMSNRQFEHHLGDLYSIFLDLLDSADDSGVRRAVTKLFRARISPTVSGEDDSVATHHGSTVGMGAQLPGELQSKVVHVKTGSRGEGGESQVDEICSALKKVGGVRSVKPLAESTDKFEVETTAPDEMVVAGAMSVTYVTGAFVDVASGVEELDRLD